jgi:hypothetical protein
MLAPVRMVAKAEFCLSVNDAKTVCSVTAL